MFHILVFFFYSGILVLSGRFLKMWWLQAELWTQVLSMTWLPDRSRRGWKLLTCWSATCKHPRDICKNFKLCFQRWPPSTANPSVCAHPHSHWGIPLPLSLGWMWLLLPREHSRKNVLKNLRSTLRWLTVSSSLFLSCSLRLLLSESTWEAQPSWMERLYCRRAKGGRRGLRPADSCINIQSWEQAFLDTTAQLSPQVITDPTKWEHTHESTQPINLWEIITGCCLKLIYFVWLHKQQKNGTKTSQNNKPTQIQKCWSSQHLLSFTHVFTINPPVLKHKLLCHQEDM